MAQRQQALAKVILKDPAVESLSSFIGVDGTNTTMNSGRIQINLKPLEKRKIDASDVIRRLQPQLANVEGITLFMQPVQDLTVEDRVSRTQFQYSLEDPDAKELATWVPKFIDKLQDAAASCATWRATSRTWGLQAQLVDRSRHRLAAGDHAADDRRHALRCVRAAADLDDVHAAQPVPRGAGGEAGFPEDPRRTCSDIYIRIARAAAWCRCSTFCRFEEIDRPAGDQPPGAVPRGHGLFNLAPGASLGEAVKAINAGQGTRSACRPSIQAGLPGDRRGVPGFADQ